MRTSFDFSPLYRSSIGFDRVFDLLENATRVQTIDNWPPYDITRTGDDTYRIQMAVAGFALDDLTQRFRAREPRVPCDKGAPACDWY